MARLITSGFELNSKTSLIEFDNSSVPGSISLVTSPVRTGTYAAQVSTSSQASFGIYNAFSTNQNTTGFARVWINITSLPLATTNILQLRNVANTAKASIALTSTGALQLVNSTSVQVGSSSTTLSTGTWYCIEVSCDASVSNGTVTGRLDGNTFATGTGNATTGWGRAAFGVITSTTATIVFDGMVINDNQGSNQNTFPGISQIARATPNAAGDSNGFLVNVGGTAGAANNFTRVQEVTPDGTTSYNASAVLNATDMFTVSTPSIPAGAVINAVMVGGQYANTTAPDATAAFKFQIIKTSGGTVSQSAAIIPNSTTMVVNNAGATSGTSVYPITLYADPDGNAWTPTTIASMQIGYDISATNTSPIAVSDVWALVDYSTEANIQISDSVTTSESIARTWVNNIATSDVSTTSESVTPLITGLRVNTFDATTITETLSIIPAKIVNVSDTVSTSESVSVSIQTFFVSVSDSVTTSESTIASESATKIAVSDAAITSELFTPTYLLPDLLIVVTPGIQQINGVKIV